jgi:pyridoxamine 5'-phosphate oxidase
MSSLSSSIADLRKSYERAELSESASNQNPLQQFDQWLQKL